MLGLVAAGSAQAAVNYLVVTFSPATSSWSSYISSQGDPVQITNSTCPDIPNGNYSTSGGNPSIAAYGSQVFSFNSPSAAQITLSIISTAPPPGSPIHYYGVAEHITSSASGTFYVAGVPSSINIQSVYSSSPQAVTLGGPALTISGQVDPATNAYVLPSLLLPDQSAFIQYPSSPIQLAYSRLANWGESPFYGNTWGGPTAAGEALETRAGDQEWGNLWNMGALACGSPTGTFDFHQLINVGTSGSASISTVLVSPSMASTATCSGCNTGTGTIRFDNPVSFQSSSTGGITFSITISGIQYNGQIGYVLGF